MLPSDAAFEAVQAELARLRRDVALAARLLEAGRDPGDIAAALRQAARVRAEPTTPPLGSVDALAAAFERHQEEYSRFDRIAEPLDPHPDLCAFRLLAGLVPGCAGKDLLLSAGSDIVHPDVNMDALARVITDPEVRDLVRCGAGWEESSRRLYLFLYHAP